MRAWLTLAAILLAPPAQAHAVVPGVGGFAGGLLHPLLVAAHAMSLVALGLLIARQSRPFAPGLVFALALCAGLIAIALAVGETIASQVLLANTAILGLAVAAAWSPPKAIGWLLAAVGGAALALDSPPDAITLSEAYRMLLGTGLSACLALALVVALTRRARRHWQIIAVRIVGSWIAASAILVLALEFAG
jgi:urease accessory protein